MRILVTGGAGYIGSHTAKLLAASGHAPIVFDDFTQGHDWAVKWGPLERGSPRRPGAACARCSPRTSRGGRGALRRQRAGGRVDEPARASTSATTPWHAEPARRDARGRRCHHRLLFDVRDVRQSGARADRRDASAGARQPVRRVQADGREDPALVRRVRTACSGWRSVTSTRRAPIPTARSARTTIPRPHLIPLVIGAALGTRPPVKVFGTDYPTPDGTAIRDYVHVMDLADAHRRAMEAARQRHARARRSTSARDRDTVVRSVIDAVNRVGGKNVPFEEAPRRAGDPPELVAAPGRAREVLGWSCRYAALEVIVEHAWKWHAGRV